METQPEKRFFGEIGKVEINLLDLNGVENGRLQLGQSIYFVSCTRRVVWNTRYYKDLIIFVYKNVYVKMSIDSHGM